MIWIPLLSVVVFAFIFVPTMIYGFKKGWKGALIISVLLFAINFIMIGIGYLMYDQIWHVYRIIFFDHHVKNNLKFDHDLLKNIYKNRVILLFSFICMPLTYLSTWIIHRLLSKLLTKHWEHKTKQISNSEKQILVRVSSNKSKLIGGAILFANSILWVSYITSSVNVMTTPWSKKNVFNNTTDLLSKIYSGDKAFNDGTPFAVEQLLSASNNGLTEGLKSLINIFDENSIKSIDNELIKKEGIIKNKDALNWIEKESPKAMDLIIEAIFSTIKNKINPLMYDQKVYEATQGNFENKTGYYGKNKRTLFINQLEEYLKDHPLKFNFSQHIQNIYVEKFEKTISSWKSSMFNRNINDAIKKNKNAKEILDTFINKRDKQIKTKTEEIRIRENKISELAKIFSEQWIKKHLVKSYIAKTVKNTGNWNKYTYDIGKISDSSFTYNEGILNKDIQTNINQELGKLNHYLLIKNKAKNSYETIKKARIKKELEFTIDVTGSKLSFKKAQEYLQTLNDDLKKSKNLYDMAVVSRKNKEKEKSRNDVEIKKLSSQLANFKQYIIDEEEKLKKKNSLKVQDNKEKKSKKEIASPNKHVIKNNPYDDAIVDTLEKILQNVKNNIKNYNQEKHTVTVDKLILEINKKNEVLNEKNKKVTVDKEKKDKSKNKELDAKKIKNEKKIQYDNLIKRNNILNGKKINSIFWAEENENNKQKKLQKIENEKNRFEKTFNIQKNIRNQLIKNQNDAQNLLNDEVNVYNKQKNKIENMKINAINIINKDTMESNKRILELDNEIAIKNDETINKEKDAWNSSDTYHDLQNLLSKDGNPINNLLELVKKHPKIKESIDYQKLLTSIEDKRLKESINIAKKMKTSYNDQKQRLITAFRKWIKT